MALISAVLKGLREAGIVAELSFSKRLRPILKMAVHSTLLGNSKLWSLLSYLWKKCLPSMLFVCLMMRPACMFPERIQSGWLSIWLVRKYFTDTENWVNTQGGRTDYDAIINEHQKQFSRKWEHFWVHFGDDVNCWIWPIRTKTNMIQRNLIFWIFYFKNHWILFSFSVSHWCWKAQIERTLDLSGEISFIRNKRNLLLGLFSLPSTM